jgi:glutamyl-tRNA synthetase
MTIVTRIAPSPTGYLHFGLARTGLFCYLFSRKHGGKFILRIEDTDLARNKPEYETDIHDQFAWLRLTPDETYKQSEHLPRHMECLKQLIENNSAYVSNEPAKDDPSRTVEVVRLRNPGERINFSDMIRGEISFDTAELGDFVIARSVSEPLYHLAVVIDDHDEGVTHVIRGEDHISNTQRHILLQRALGFEQPTYAHLPLILMPDKSKMSKRREGSSVKHYRDNGILPEALINYIALLGWNPGTEQELFSLDELVQYFDISKIQKSGAVFDEEKLHWFNKEYLSRLSNEAFFAYIDPVFQAAIKDRGIEPQQAITMKIIPIIRERIATYADLERGVREGEYDLFFVEPAIDAGILPGKGGTAETAREHLSRVHELLCGLDDEIFADPERLKSVVWDYATEKGRGLVLWPLRYALSGREKSPDPFLIASILGKERTLERISEAQKKL